MTSLQTPSGPIAYDEQGDPSGLPIVLLPSGAHDRHDFDVLRERLPERFRTIALDWPGHGESLLGDSPFTVTRAADVTEALVAQLAPQGAVVLGNSVGGYSATRLALRRPELVQGLVIVDGGGFGTYPPPVRLFCALMARPGFLRRIYPRFASRYMHAKTDADRRALATGIATTRADPGLQAVAGLWGSFPSTEHDLRAAASAISAPTLVLWGRRDPVIPVKVGRRIADLIPGARLHVFDAGHCPHTTDPDGVAAQLIPFADAALAHQRRSPATTL
ncbi:alpha/beta fold hydrolase [Baekduia alba]|uniref:alpha/beta fold hydrolase n=1 Tax=Baekduia alba TaxID=2997333 RepID=UPI0023412BA1|nr:alpha/beta hydrolase [Baekduia alba]